MNKTGLCMPGVTELWDKARSRPVSRFRKVFFFRLLLFCPCSIEQTSVLICMMLKFHAQKSYAVNLFDIYGSLKKKKEVTYVIHSEQCLIHSQYASKISASKA